MPKDYKPFEIYLKQTMFPADAELSFEEISEGNINHIYRAKDIASGRSVILKQAEYVSRISPDICLNTDRGKREAAYFDLFAAQMPDSVPQVFAYDEAQRLIVMQDLKNCPVLRKAMLAEQMSSHLGEKLGAFVAKTTAATSDFCLSHPEKRKMQQPFSNPELCDLTEKLVLTDPFVGAKENGVCAENAAFLERQIYQNAHLRQRAAELKYRFMNLTQALVHGDLHFGSVFLNGDTPVIFDSEFCFFGPIGFDLGNLLAHFLMETLYTRVRGGDVLFERWLREMTAELLHTFEKEFRAAVQKGCTDAVLQNAPFLETFIASVFADTAGFAGAECLRRTIGIAKIPEFDLLEKAQRVQFERKIMNAGVLLMEHMHELNSADALLTMIEKNSN